MSFFDNVANYIDTIFGRVPESMNIRDIPNPRKLPRSNNKKKYPITDENNVIRDIIKNYDTPTPLPPPNVETISKNVLGITKKIRKHLPKQPRGTAKERQQIKDILKEYDTPHALSDPSSERLHKNLKGISKAISKHLPEAETKESHESYMNSSTYQNKLIEERKAKEKPIVSQVVLPTPSPAAHEPTPPPVVIKHKPKHKPRVTTQDGTKTSAVVAYTPPPPIIPSVSPSVYNSKALVVYTPPTVNFVQESIPSVLIPDNIQPEIIINYLKKQSNLRKGKYSNISNKSIVDQSRVAAQASFSNLRKK
jgi:hypothetical protein